MGTLSVWAIRLWTRWDLTEIIVNDVHVYEDDVDDDHVDDDHVDDDYSAHDDYDGCGNDGIM